MAAQEDDHQSTLIARLASTTLRLRNLFYVNLLLAAAVIFLIFQDRTFVSEKIGPAVAVMQPILEVDRFLKAEKPRFSDYHKSLLQAFAVVQDVSRGLDRNEDRIDAMSPEERDAFRAQRRAVMTEEEIDFIDSLTYVHDHSQGLQQLVANYFDLKLAETDYLHLSGFAAFLLLEDTWTEVLFKGRGIVLKANLSNPITLDLQPLQDLEPAYLGLENYNDDKLENTVLENLLDDLPSVGQFLQAVMVIGAFCDSNGLGTCSIKDIEDWRRLHDAQSSSRLSAPGIEVQLTRDIVVPAAPLILLVAFHLYLLQFRRRQVLRDGLSRSLSPAQLSLLDETWVLNGLLLNVTQGRGFWRHLQSAVMLAFLLLAQMAPLVAVLLAGYYTFNQVLLSAFIREEIAAAVMDMTQAVADIGVTVLPQTFEPEGVVLEYLWLVVAGFCALVLIGSLVELLRDQAKEVRQGWARPDPA